MVENTHTDIVEFYGLQVPNNAEYSGTLQQAYYPYRPEEKTVNRLRILKRLGSGGQSTVDLVENNGVLRVLKLSSSPLYIDSDFERQSGAHVAASRVDPAHFPHIYDFGVYKKHYPADSPYSKLENFHLGILMEYLEGYKDLSKLESILSWDTKIKIFDELAEAIFSLHSQDIFHFDIKPSNVMVHTDGENIKNVKLIDIGHAGIPEDINAFFLKAQSFHYRGPESYSYQPGHKYKSKEEMLLSGRLHDIQSAMLVFLDVILGGNPFAKKDDAIQAIVPNTLHRYYRWEDSASGYVETKAVIEKVMLPLPDVLGSGLDIRQWWMSLKEAYLSDLASQNPQTTEQTLQDLANQ